MRAVWCLQSFHKKNFVVGVCDVKTVHLGLAFDLRKGAEHSIVLVECVLCSSLPVEVDEGFLRLKNTKLRVSWTDLCTSVSYINESVEEVDAFNVENGFFSFTQWLICSSLCVVSSAVHI